MRLVAVVFLALIAAGCGQQAPENDRSAALRVPLGEASPNILAPARARATIPPASLQWTHARSARAAWYGPPGAPALLAIACEGWDKRAGRLVIVRYARADKGAQALFAIQGSKGILRLPVSAVKIGEEEYVWRGILDSADPRVEVLLGGGLKATVPGGGELGLPPMGAAGAVVSECVLRQAQDERGSEGQTLPNRASNPATSPAAR